MKAWWGIDSLFGSKKWNIDDLHSKFDYETLLYQLLTNSNQKLYCNTPYHWINTSRRISITNLLPFRNENLETKFIYLPYYNYEKFLKRWLRISVFRLRIIPNKHFSRNLKGKTDSFEKSEANYNDCIKSITGPI